MSIFNWYSPVLDLVETTNNLWNSNELSSPVDIWIQNNLVENCYCYYSTPYIFQQLICLPLWTWCFCLLKCNKMQIFQFSILNSHTKYRSTVVARRHEFLEEFLLRDTNKSTKEKVKKTNWEWFSFFQLSTTFNFNNARRLD